jgi:hypothetical protein
MAGNNAVGTDRLGSSVGSTKRSAQSIPLQVVHRASLALMVGTDHVAVDTNQRAVGTVTLWSQPYISSSAVSSK